MIATEQYEPEEITNMFPNLVISAPQEGSDPTDSEGQRKLFVGGLSWQTTEDGLKQYFESLGIVIEKVIIMRDKITGRSRGFGFVTLKNVEDIDKAVSTRLHLGRKIEAKRAIPKRDMDNNSKKLFVGGIPISLTNSEFRQFFETYGAVADAQIMTERQTGHSRGFGFVTFEEDEVARNALKARHVIQGKTVEVKKAQPKKVERQPVHIVHPYPVSFFPPYPPMYPPTMYGAPHTLYQPAPMSYDPYFMGQPSGVMYAPHYVDSAYSPPHVNPHPRATVSPRAGSHVTRKTSSADVYSPSLVRPNTNQTRLSANRRGSSLYGRGSLGSSPWSSYFTPPERTERAWSAGPVGAFGTSPPSTATIILSPPENNARKRGMSHPPIVNRRPKSSLISFNHTPPKPSTQVSRSAQSARRSSHPKEEETGGLHKYFQ